MPTVFSFLTPAYRAEDTLHRTIDSVRAQTRSDWELVVTDNGMSDPIADIVRSYAHDPRIRLVRQPNNGPDGGTMASAAVAVGDVFVPLNSDDAVEPGYLERVGAVLDAEPGVGAVTCDAWTFTDPGCHILPRSYLQTAGAKVPPDPSRPLRVADVVDGPCPFYGGAIRREVWEAVDGLHSDSPAVGDLDFWLRTLVGGHDVRILPDRLARYRVEPGSVSKPVDDPEASEAIEQQRYRVLRRAALAVGDAESLAALSRFSRREGYFQEIRRARVALDSGDVVGARTHARAAFAHRHTARAGLIVTALKVAPGAMARVHPMKRRAEDVVRTTARTLRPAARRSGDG
ncbi:MAG: hypothetical protein ABS81_11700 [Pseudonocardia sp. SCN 72-86]|nr:MAG: hypothetical protein ABS81_11700 [Pseudonocardia sp. SCN 72-86]